MVYRKFGEDAIYMIPVDPSGDYEERYDSSAWISFGEEE
jgi:hypothetical protein